MKFKKHYNEAIEALEYAHKGFMEEGIFVPAALCLIELAWLNINGKHSGGMLKSKRFFKEAQVMLQVYGQNTAAVSPQYARGGTPPPINIHDISINEVRARLCHYQGLTAYREKRYGQGVRLFKMAQSYCLKSSLEYARILDSLSVHYERTGDYLRAVEHVAQALDIKEQYPDLPHEIAVSCQILGRLHVLMEKFDKAIRALNKALSLADQLGDERRCASLRNELIKVHLLSGKLDALSSIFEPYEQMDEQMDDQEVHTITHDTRLERLLPIDYAMKRFYQAYYCFLRQNATKSQSILEKIAIPTFQNFNFHKGLGLSERLLGAIKCAQGDYQAAIEHMGNALGHFRQVSAIDEQVKSHFELGKVFDRMRKTEMALDSMLEALKIAEQNNLVNLVRYIEDEIFRLDENTWQAIVDKRARHEQLFGIQSALKNSL